jgi:Na+-translocating ferredoxin:NAD+ oxidoreductase RnfG subunit
LSSEALRRLIAAVLTVGGLALAGLPTVVSAKVFHARDEALELAFPGADRVEARDFYLKPEQRAEIEKLAKSALDGDLVTLYVGFKGEAPMGYAAFDTRTVRTQAATFLVVVSPEGTVAGAQVLAFHEPEEYVPTERWRDSMKGAKLDDELEVGRSVAAITGSTLSTQAITAGVRRALALWTVLIKGK